MKTKITKVYYCDFCKKKTLTKHSMTIHEDRCMMNPINHRPCLICRHLDRTEIEYDTGIMRVDGNPIYAKANGFICKKLDKLLIHPKARFGKHIGFIESVRHGIIDEREQFDMPEQCSIFDDEIKFCDWS